ncbi:MAG TPA: M56 family metallopeptidase [Pirellulales bacterium]|nr:M56 family metallopeptidase [Pirellulales bacterium]
MNGFTDLVSGVLIWSEEGLGLAIDAGALAALLATIVLAVNVFVRRWLSARQMGLLWGLVLLRLLLPVAPPSSFSLQNLLPSFVSEGGEPRDIDPQPAAGYMYAAPQPQPYEAAELALAASPPTGPDLTEPGDNVAAMLRLVWLAGAAVFMLATLIGHGRFCRRLRRAQPIDDPKLCDLWKSCRQMAGVRVDVPMLLFDGVEQPAVSGMLRPKLLLPPHVADLDEQQLRMVMLHELAHVRRWHVAANWLLVIIRAAHWWNPVFWLAAARFQSLREQACDAFALERIDGVSSHSYGELLLALADRRQSASWRIVLPVSILGFLPTYLRKRAMGNRLRALRAAGVKRSGWHTATVSGMVALAAACGLTDAGSAQAPPPQRWFNWLPDAGFDLNHWDSAPEVDRGPLVTRTYAVAKALERIADDERSEDKAARKLKALLIHTLAGMEGHYRSPDKAAAAVALPAPVATRLQEPDMHVMADRPSAEERVTLTGTALTVTASPGAHAEIARNLQAWEQSGLAQICVETRFVTDDRDIASASGISWRYLEAFSADGTETFAAEASGGMPVVHASAAVEYYLPIAVANLSRKQASAFVNRAQDSRQANLLQAPKITLFNGQRGTLFDFTQTPFVVGIHEDLAGRQQPKIEVIDEGTTLTLRAIQSPNDAKVQIEAGVELSEISGVGTVSTLFHGEPTSIQIPRVKRCRIDVASELPDGESLLIGCIPSYEQKRFSYILLTVRSLGAIADDSP